MNNLNLFEKKTFLANIAFIAIIFCLNFIGSSFLKYVYITYATFIFIVVLSFPFHFSILYIICFAFLEGQGRILWNYHPLARIIFDLTIVMAILKDFVIKRDLNIVNHFNKLISFFLLLHFLWYLVEIFNPDLPSIAAPIAASKIYLLPPILFLALVKNKSISTETILKKISIIILAFVFLECALAIYQQNLKDPFMLQISPFYERAMRDGIFAGDGFRPFGTTFLPGAVAPYLFLTFSFIFLRRHLSRKYLFLILCTLVIITITLLTSQVRSAMVKFVLILLTTIFSFIITSKNKIRSIIMLTLTIICTVTMLLISDESLFSNNRYLDLNPGIMRWEKVNNLEGFKAGRAGPVQAFGIMTEKLSKFPLGTGPGVTGAAASIIQDEIKNNPLIDANNYWGYDNFYLSLIVEFGLGAIFYLGFILSVLFSIIRKLPIIFEQRDAFKTRTTLIALSNMVIILIGNWMAIGLPYNPESFFYWIWAAIGFNITKDKAS